MALGSVLLIFILLLLFSVSQVLSSHCDSLDLNQMRSANKNRHCQLNQYRIQDVVQCINQLHVELNHGTSGPALHFMFLGDSRTRALFRSFLRSFPDYDLHWSQFQRSDKFHSDVDVDSDILNIRISFRWRPLLDESTRSELSKWISSAVQIPTFVLIGVSVWHMLHRFGGNDDGQVFRRNLSRLEPQLGIISQSADLVWVDQLPSGNSDYDKFESEIGNVLSLRKIHQYNLAARRILGKTAIIWDSSRPLADEYIRGCSINYRMDRAQHINCDDDIHLGYAIMVPANQLLLNHICRLKA